MGLALELSIEASLSLCRGPKVRVLAGKTGHNFNTGLAGSSHSMISGRIAVYCLLFQMSTTVAVAQQERPFNSPHFLEGRVSSVQTYESTLFTVQRLTSSKRAKRSFNLGMSLLAPLTAKVTGEQFSSNNCFALEARDGLNALQTSKKEAKRINSSPLSAVVDLDLFSLVASKGENSPKSKLKAEAIPDPALKASATSEPAASKLKEVPLKNLSPSAGTADHNNYEPQTVLQSPVRTRNIDPLSPGESLRTSTNENLALPRTGISKLLEANPFAHLRPSVGTPAEFDRTLTTARRLPDHVPDDPTVDLSLKSPKSDLQHAGQIQLSSPTERLANDFGTLRGTRLESPRFPDHPVEDLTVKGALKAPKNDVISATELRLSPGERISRRTIGNLESNRIESRLLPDHLTEDLTVKGSLKPPKDDALSATGLRLSPGDTISTSSIGALEVNRIESSLLPDHLTEDLTVKGSLKAPKNDALSATDIRSSRPGSNELIAAAPLKAASGSLIANDIATRPISEMLVSSNLRRPAELKSVEGERQVLWDRWFQNFGKMGDQKLVEALKKRGNPAGANSISITVDNNQVLKVELLEKSGEDFDAATLEAYRSLNGDSALTFPAGSALRKMSFVIDNSHESSNEITDIEGRRVTNFKEAN